MDPKENKQISEVKEQNSSVQSAPTQKLSSEESYSKDYELFSKKSDSKVLYIVLGVVLVVLILAVSLYFSGIIKF
jgi:hypothetical protein